MVRADTSPPDPSFSVRFCPAVSTDSTVPGMARAIPIRTIRSLSANENSPSRNGRRMSRPSTRVTLIPSAANMQAYSHPITPPPITAMEGGISLS